MSTKKTLMGTSFSDRIFNVVVYVFVIGVMIVTLYPFLNVLALSLNESIDSVRGGITIYPPRIHA